MPQLDKANWGWLPLIIVFLFGLVWIYFILYTRMHSKTALIFSSYLHYKKLFLTSDFLVAPLAENLKILFFVIDRQNIEYQDLTAKVKEESNVK